MDAPNFMTRNGPLSGFVDRIRDLCATNQVEDPHVFDPALLGASSRIGFLVSTTPGVGLGFIELEERISELLGEEVVLIARDSPAERLIQIDSVSVERIRPGPDLISEVQAVASVRAAGYAPGPDREARDDEREALIERFDALRGSGVCSPTTCDLLDDAERLLRKHPEPGITDEQAIDRAARIIFAEYVGKGPGGFEKGYLAYDRSKAERTARAALEAALRVPVGEGEQR